MDRTSKNSLIVSLISSFLMLALLDCRVPIESPHREISLDEGTNMSIALSPDGRYLITDVLGRLWKIPVKGGKALPLTNEYGNARQPSWSPEGNALAFQAYWEGNWHIYRLDIENNSVERLTDGAFDHREPYWSPRGEAIVYSSDREGSYDIWLRSLETGLTHQVTKSDFNEYEPAWAVGSDRIAYVSDDPNAPGIHMISLTDSTHEYVMATTKEVHGIEFDSDGTGISYVEMSFQECAMNYITVAGRGTTVQQLSENGEDVFPFRLQWTDDNTFIYAADGKIKRKELDSRNISEIPFEVTVAIPNHHYEKRKRNFDAQKNILAKGLAWPDLSPDALSLACVMLGDVWIIHENGYSNRLTHDSHLEMYPEWSPDGKNLAYLSDRDGAFHLYIRNLESGSDRKLSELPGDVSGIAWSPEGGHIAVSSAFGPRLGKVSVVSISNGHSRDVTPYLTSSPGAPSWSQDGKSLAFGILSPYSTRFREGVNRIVRYDLQGNFKGVIGTNGGLSLGVRAKDGPAWSPDGKYMAIVSSGRLLIWQLDTKGNAVSSTREITEKWTDVPSWDGSGRRLGYLFGNEYRIFDLETGKNRTFKIKLSWDRQVEDQRTVIHCGTLFDAKSGSVQEMVDVYIIGNRIMGIHPAGQVQFPEDAVHIDALEQFVMPGMIDVHAHQGSWGGKKMGLAWLSWGVTSTRDPASDPYDALNRKEGMESGNLISPRVFFTGSPIDGNRIYYSGASTHSTEKQVLDQIEKASLLEYDMVKTYVRLPDPLQKIVIDASHQIGLPVSSHELYPAILFGIDGVEHILGTSRRGYSPKMTYCGNSYDDVTSLLAASGVSFTPTTGIYVSYAYLLSQDSSILEDQRFKYFASPNYLTSAKASLDEVRTAPLLWERQFKNSMAAVLDVHQKGGTISAGTDSPIIPYGMALHMELRAYAAAGMSNSDVLKTATVNAAKALGVEEQLGTIEEGKLADLIILNANPLEKIENTIDVDKIMVNGAMWSLSELLNK